MDINILKNEKDTLEFEISCDRAIPEMIVDELNRNPAVVFVAYKVEHPIIGKPKIVVRTKGKNALDVTLAALETISDRVDEFRKAFKKAK